MGYHSISYFAFFLPLAMIAYQVVPQKYRKFVLLLANAVFFWIQSKFLIVYISLEILLVYFFGKKLGSMKKGTMDRKVFQKKKARVLRIGVLLLLGILIALKYTNFLGETFISGYQKINILVPIGISYYTLQGISYLSDVKNKKYPSGSLMQVALYLSFFPTIMEGPITRFNEVGEDLIAGEKLNGRNVTMGYERILWGLFKKLCIADHLGPAVNYLFDHWDGSGVLALLGAVLCTIQLYMDFAGTIDIAIGSAEIFNVTLPENFRQPFFAKNAGDFWHRWHITLGTFFRDYIFYPVSLSKPVQKLTKKCNGISKKLGRYIGPSIALLLVWLANGFWHGANWTYVGYGLYYFVLMFIEQLFTKPFEERCRRVHLDGWPLRIFRFVKLFIIVIIGEMFFRAATFSNGWKMFTAILTDHNLTLLRARLGMMEFDSYDFVSVGICFIVVIIVSVMEERGIHTAD